jgi:Rieske Fe-S protein
MDTKSYWLDSAALPRFPRIDRDIKFDVAGKARSLRAVRRGKGANVELEGKRVAAYRDEKGKVTCCSPVCTHLGCLVACNYTERTWDCPSHGSRFKPTGEVLSGPAEEDLTRV